MSVSRGLSQQPDSSVFRSLDTRLSNLLLPDGVWTIHIMLKPSDENVTVKKPTISDTLVVAGPGCNSVKMQSVKGSSQNHQGVIMRLLFGVKSPFTM